MQIEAKIDEARRARQRRSRIGNVVWVVAALVAVGSVVAFGRHPLVGVAALAMSMAFTATRWYIDGNDELQRRRAIRACAVGCGAGIAWVVIDVVRVAALGGEPDGQLRTLAIAGAAWMTSELLVDLRQDGDKTETSA